MKLYWKFPRPSPFVFIMNNDTMGNDRLIMRYFLPERGITHEDQSTSTHIEPNVSVSLTLSDISWADAGVYYIQSGHNTSPRFGRKLLYIFGNYCFQ